MVKPKSELLWLVYLSPNLFRLAAVFPLLKGMGAIVELAANDDLTVEGFQKLGYVLLFPKRVEEDHGFGPKLIFGKGSLEMTAQVPWSEVFYMFNVSGEVAQSMMGFAKPSI